MILLEFISEMMIFILRGYYEDQMRNTIRKGDVEEEEKSRRGAFVTLLTFHIRYTSLFLLISHVNSIEDEHICKP